MLLTVFVQCATVEGLEKSDYMDSKIFGLVRVVVGVIVLQNKSETRSDDKIVGLVEQVQMWKKSHRCNSFFFEKQKNNRQLL
jgi:hypothetical protein